MTESRAALSDQAASLDVTALPRLALPCPLHDYVLIKLSEPKTRTTDAGLELPQIVQDEPIEGVVIMTGSGRMTEHGEFIPMSEDIYPGQRVLFAKYAGHEYAPFSDSVDVEKRGDIYRLLRVEEILGVFE